MAERVAITESLLDTLADAISTKSGESTPMTLAEMTDAVNGISAPTGTVNINSNGTHNVLQYAYADVSVPGGAATLQSKSKGYTPTESAQTETVSADVGYDGLSSVDISVGAISSSYVGSAIDRRDSTDLSASGATVSAPAGYYASSASASVASGTEGTPTATKGTVSSHSIAVTPSVTNSAGYIAGGTHTGAPVSVSASELVSGTKSITSNGTNIDVKNYAAVDVAVPSGTPNLQSKSKSYTPTETTQSETVGYDAGYDGLSSVDISVGAISSTYVGTGITRRDSTDLGASGATVTAPAGYYASAATKTIGSGSATPAATISATGASVSTGTNTLTLSKTVSNTPQVSVGYVSSGTAGNSSVSLTASVTTKGATTYHPSTSDQSIASGTYTTGAQTIKAVTLANLIAGNIKKDVVVKVGDSTDDDCVASVTGTYEASGGTDHLTKLATKSLGTISTSSTSAVDTGQTLDVTGFDDYDMLIAICHTSPHTNGRHVATVRLINFSATTNVNTKTSTAIASSTPHYRLSSSGTLSQRSGSTAYGVYVNAATIQTTTPRKCTLTIYQRYNSTSSGTINGNYVLDVYGVKLQDLF